MKSASLKVRWLAAFLTVIIIMSAASFTGSMLTLRAVEKDADRSHENSAAFMKNMLDDFWKRVYDYSWQIINASDARQMEREGVDAMRPNAYAFSLEFRNYTQSNTMVEDLYLYFPTSDTVIGTKGVYAKHIYWAALYGINGEISEDDWQTNFFENRTSGYFTVKNGNHPELFYRMSSVKANGRILIAKIRTEELERTLNWICSNSETSFLAMSDEIGNVYAYAGNYDRFANAETNTVSTVVGKEYLFTENPSDLTGLSYVTITEKSTAYRLIVGIMRVSFISLLIAFAVSLVLAIVFVRRSLRPVEKIIEKLHPGELPEGNEISFIDQQIDALLAENRQSVDQLMKERNTMARRTFLSEALKFDTVMQRDIEIIAGFYGQEFENERYVVIVRERSGEDNSSRILQYHTASLAYYTAKAWQAVIDSGKQLPDLYIVQISIGGEGLFAGVDDRLTGMWSMDKPQIMKPGSLPEVDISLYPLALHTIRLVRKDLESHFHAVCQLGLHWIGSEQDTLEGICRIAGFDESYDHFFDELTQATGADCPLVLYHLACARREKVTQQGMAAVNAMFERQCRRYPSAYLVSAGDCPFYAPAKPSLGIFAPDNVHYLAKTQRWFSDQLLKRYGVIL